MESRRDEYLRKLKIKLDEWNADIDRLENRLQSAADAARREYQDQISHLRARCEDLERKSQGLRSAAEEAWEDVKVGVDAAADALGSAIRSARERFGGSASVR